MLLPTTKSIPETDLSKYLIMIYGRQGIGKTTLATQFPDALCLMFEPGAKALSIYKKDILSWKTFIQIIDELYTEKHTYKTIVIDTYPQAYELCSQYVCEANDWEHPGDGGYGKGWDAVYTELAKQMNRLISKFGVILIAHADTKEVEQLDGSVKDQIAPDMKGQPMRFIARAVDLLAYYYYSEKGNRFIRVVDDGKAMAKNRIKGHFVDIPKFKAGKDEEETYQRFLAAFNNQTVKESINGQTQHSGKSQGVFQLRRK